MIVSATRVECFIGRFPGALGAGSGAVVVGAVPVGAAPFSSNLSCVVVLDAASGPSTLASQIDVRCRRPIHPGVENFSKRTVPYIAAPRWAHVRDLNGGS